MSSTRAKLFNHLLRILTARRLDPNADPRLLRQRLDRLIERFNRPLRHARAEPLDVEGIAAEWVVPDTEIPGRFLLYLHGGGYIFCNPRTHRSIVSNMARAARTRALVIDYRLAPEHPFPAAVEDTLKAYRWLLSQGADPASIAIAGDSAGGGLSLALLLALRDKGEPLPAGAALLSPWTDLAASGWTHVTHARLDPMLGLDGLLLAARHYLQGAVPTDPLASPLFGRLEGLPPLAIHVGDREILLDDSLRLAEKARAAGVAVDLKVWHGLPHVFQAASFLPEARLSLGQLGEFLDARMKAAP